MTVSVIDPNRVRGAWEGRISGRILGKPLELISMFQGRAAVRSYLVKYWAGPVGRSPGRGPTRGKAGWRWRKGSPDWLPEEMA